MSGPRLSLRMGFMIATVLIVAGVDLAAGLYLETQLRAAHNSRVEAEVSHHAQLARDMFARQLGRGDLELSIAALDPVADRLGESMAARVTVIGADGAVLGDSSLSPAEVAAVENHGSRPEVLAASADRCGLARRYSNTLDKDMLYCALSFELDEGRTEPATAYVRVATAIELIDDSIRQLRLSLLFGGLLAVGLAVGAGLVASRILYGKLRGLVEAAQALAGGDEAALVRLGSDEVDGLVGTLNRVSTQLERAVRDLARQRDSFEAVIDSMADGLVVLDDHRRIVVINPAAAALLAVAGDPRGRPLVEVARIPELFEAMHDTAAGESLSIDVDFDAGGIRRILLVRATSRGDGEGVVLVLHDETDIRRLETTRRDFVANVSHELRSPVSVIRANADTLLSDGLLDNRVFAERFIEAIERNAKRLDQLISDLLDISRIDAGKYRLELGPVELVAVVERARAGVEGHRARREVRLDCELDSDLCVIADPSALEQVLSNLLENAIKYGPEGGHVELVAHASAAQVRIEVRDEGPGIPPKHRARVFERFYRVDPGRSRNMGGTGLGLAIVRNLTEAMGGQVGVEPREPSGACFWLVLKSCGEAGLDS